MDYFCTLAFPRFDFSSFFSDHHMKYRYFDEFGHFGYIGSFGGGGDNSLSHKMTTRKSLQLLIGKGGRKAKEEEGKTHLSRDKFKDKTPHELLSFSICPPDGGL